MEILKQIVMNRENMAEFSHMIHGVLYYKVSSDDGTMYIFPIDGKNLDDIGTTTFEAKIKAITLMRYIRKAISNKSLMQINNINVD